MKNKKATTEMAILLLVLIVFALIGFALFTFVSQKTELRDFYYCGIEEVYITEEQINFLLLQGISKEEALSSFEDARLLGNGNIEVKKQINEERNKMLILYHFKPKKFET